MNKKEIQKLFIEHYGGWILICFFSVIPVLRLMTLSGFAASITTPYGFWSFLGKAAGLAGFVLYAINLLLSVRKRWLENFFNGLNRVYIAHHITGAIALILLAFHPLFLAVRYIQIGVVTSYKDAAVALLPSTVNLGATGPEIQRQLAQTNGFVAFTGMVTLLILTFFIKLPYRVWLFTHKFLGPAFFIATLHIILVQSDISRDPFMKIYLLIWAVIGLAAFTYRTLFGSIFVRKYPFQVKEVVKLPHNILAIDMIPVEENVPFKAGQFVFVRFMWQKKRGILPEFHPFSIASAPHDGVMRLCIKALGDHTKSLMGLPPGTIAEVEGAFGKFDYQRFDFADQIWIAGGIGITPFLGMASTLNSNSPNITLFYSVNRRDELIGHSVFESVGPKLSSKFAYVPFVHDETNAFLDVKFIESKVSLQNKEIFLCGPPPMMKSIKKQLKQKGVPSIRIHSEEFGMQ